MAAENNIFFLADRRAPKPEPRPARLLRLDVMAPAIPGGKHHAQLLENYIDPGLDASANLERYAEALEEIAGRFRSAARRDAS